VWIIAEMESPGAIDQGSCGAQSRRITAAADRQVGDYAISVTITMPTISLRCVASIAVAVEALLPGNFIGGPFLSSPSKTALPVTHRLVADEQLAPLDLPGYPTCEPSFGGCA
jgi:hypothetical protein